MVSLGKSAQPWPILRRLIIVCVVTAVAATLRRSTGGVVYLGSRAWHVNAKGSGSLGRAHGSLRNNYTQTQKKRQSRDNLHIPKTSHHR